MTDEQIIELIRECNKARCDYSVQAAERGWAAYHGGCPGYAANPGNKKPHWALKIDLAAKLEVSEEVLLDKIKPLIEVGVVDGCACGCRGDFTIPGAYPWT